MTVISLALPLPARSLRHSLIAQSTTLHSSKGLAVSLFDFAQSLTAQNLYEDLSVTGYFFPFEKKRHCSHLIDHSRRVLPPTFLRSRSSVLENKCFKRQSRYLAANFVCFEQKPLKLHTLPKADKIGECPDFPRFASRKKQPRDNPICFGKERETLYSVPIIRQTNTLGIGRRSCLTAQISSFSSFPSKIGTG